MLSPKTQNLLRNIFAVNGGSPLAAVRVSVSAIPLGVIRFSFLALGNAIKGLGFVVLRRNRPTKKGMALVRHPLCGCGCAPGYQNRIGL